MFSNMRLKVKGLSLVEAPRVAGESTVLISRPGCMQQQLHTDFDPARVKQLLREDRLVGCPSACCAVLHLVEALWSFKIRVPDKPRQFTLTSGRWLSSLVTSSTQVLNTVTSTFAGFLTSPMRNYVLTLRTKYISSRVGVEDAATADAVPLSSVPESSQPNVQVSPIAAARVEPATRKRSRRISLTVPNTRSQSNACKGAATKYV